MIRFVARRLLVSILVVVAASFTVFTLVAASGDPLAEQRARPGADLANIERRAAELHLDRPIPVRWAIWAKGLLHGDMGRSVHGVSVSDTLTRVFPVTLRLVAAALALALVMSVVLGAVSAVRPYSAFDHTGTVVAFVFLSVPAFWLAAVFKDAALELNERLGTTVFVFVGERSPMYSSGLIGTFADRLGHLVLPALTLSLLVMADWSRFVRASMLDALGSDYVRTARAKGLPERRVVTHHALRNSLGPLTTAVSLTCAELLGGAIVVERVFGWHGSGERLLHGLSERDVNMVSGWLLIGAVAVVVLNLIADIAYGVLDPRVRHG